LKHGIQKGQQALRLVNMKAPNKSINYAGFGDGRSKAAPINKALTTKVQ
tara:strand:- start:361 stop:507 length:147 start_codon:yes stop_codon:yes gene_type:complete